MTTKRTTIGATVLLVAGFALALFAHGCSSSSDTSGGPLGNPDCDGGCDDAVLIDSSLPDTDFHVDTAPTDTKGNEAPAEASSDAGADAEGDAATDG
jgi:hypothetical protein